MSLKAGWDNVAEVPYGEPTKFKVEDLIPKKTYKFRIRAVNKIGSSEPGLFSKPVLAKDPWGKAEAIARCVLIFHSNYLKNMFIVFIWVLYPFKIAKL